MSDNPEYNRVTLPDGGVIWWYWNDNGDGIPMAVVGTVEDEHDLGMAEHYVAELNKRIQERVMSRFPIDEYQMEGRGESGR